MTMAVCIRCGEEKFGAWTPCPNCGFLPEEKEDVVKSVILTDHHFSHDELDQLAAVIKSGGDVEYPQDLLEEWMKQDFETVVMEPPGGCGGDLGCLLILAIPAVFGLVALIWLIVALVNYLST